MLNVEQGKGDYIMKFMTMTDVKNQLGESGSYYNILSDVVRRHLRVVRVGRTFLIDPEEFETKKDLLKAEIGRIVKDNSDKRIDKRLKENRAIIPDEVKLLAKKKRLLSDILKIEKQLKEMN